MSMLLRKIRQYEFLLYLMAGGTAVAITFVSRIIFNIYLDYSTSIILASFIGMLVAFALNKILVFKADRRMLRQAVVFMVIYILGILQTYLISIYLNGNIFPAIRLNWHPKEIAHVIGIVIPTFTSYFGHRFVTFRTKNVDKKFRA